MNIVNISIKESDLEKESIRIGYMNMWSILMGSLSEEEQEKSRIDYLKYKDEKEINGLVPLHAYVWGLLNFDIQVGYRS